MEELRERLRDTERIGTPQEQQSQLTWTIRSSQRLNHQPKREHGLDLGCLLSSSAAWFSSESQNNKDRSSHKSCDLSVGWVLLSGLPSVASVREEALALPWRDLKHQPHSPFPDLLRGRGWEHGGRIVPEVTGKRTEM